MRDDIKAAAAIRETHSVSREGYCAYLEGKTLTANPYPKDTWQRYVWAKEWKRTRVMYREGL